MYCSQSYAGLPTKSKRIVYIHSLRMPSDDLLQGTKKYKIDYEASRYLPKMILYINTTKTVGKKGRT